MTKATETLSATFIYLIIYDICNTFLLMLILILYKTPHSYCNTKANRDYI